MAYITTGEVKAIRDTLKAAFPEFKFSVRREHHSAVEVCIMSGPLDLTGDIYINEYHYERQLKDSHPELVNMLDAITLIVKSAGREWYDRSDSMVDYFDTAFYYGIQVGKWNKKYEIKFPKKSKGLYHIPDFLEEAKTALAVTKLAA